MVESKSVIKDSACGMAAVRSGLVALAFFLTICAPLRLLYAQPAQGDHAGAESMMGHTNGWMGGWAAGGGMWLWTVIGVLVVVLLVVVIAKLSKK